MDPLDQVGDPTRGKYGVLKLQTSPLGIDSASGSADLANGNYSNNYAYILSKYESVKIY